jgi:hypothetical protein
MGSNLPPGVTPGDIDKHFGGPDHEHEFLIEGDSIVERDGYYTMVNILCEYPDCRVEKRAYYELTDVVVERGADDGEDWEVPKDNFNVFIDIFDQHIDFDEMGVFSDEYAVEFLDDLEFGDGEFTIEIPMWETTVIYTWEKDEEYVDYA